MILDRVDHRCLGAIEFIDGLTSARVREPLRLQCSEMRLQANGSALYVIRAAAGLEAHLEPFLQPPTAPPFASASYTLQVSDPQRRYLPRNVRIQLPRKAVPQDDADSVLRPIQVRLYPGGARAVDPLWAVLRASVFVKVGDNRVGVANAWLTLQPAIDGALPVSALSDGNGEALLAVTGVAPIRPAAGSDDDPDVVYTRQFGATLRVVLHQAMVQRADATAPLLLADPDRIEEDLALGPPTVQILNPPVGPLSAGALQRVDVEVAL